MCSMLIVSLLHDSGDCPYLPFDVIRHRSNLRVAPNGLRRCVAVWCVAVRWAGQARQARCFRQMAVRYIVYIMIRQYIRTIPEYRGDQFHARATKSHPRIFSFFSRSRLTLPARLQAQINDIIGSTVEKNLSRFCRCVRKNEMMIPRE